MVEESANNKENNTSSAAQNEQPKKQSAKDFIEGLFANDNYLCTMPKAKLPDGSALNINDETRRRLALFADGTLLISKDHRFDGPVLSFLSIAEKKGIKMKSPVYISQNELATIYAMAERNQVFSEDDEDLARLQMQRDFVNIIKRASSMKVSDVHVVVSDNCTEIFFRANGVMIKEMEYSKEWGDQFVRAAFASADISDANYAQNEFQGAQKLGSTPLRGSKGKLMLPHNVLAIRLQFNPIAFGSQYLVMRILYADDNPDARYALRQALNAQRTADYKAGTYQRAGGVVDPVPDDAPFFVKDYHDYYKTPRGYHPRSLNSTDGWNVTSPLSLLNAKLLAYANEIRSAVLVIHGDKAHSCYFSRDAFARLQGGNKELLLIPGAVHTDLYDRMDIIPFDRIEAFYRQYLK